VTEMHPVESSHRDNGTRHAVRPEPIGCGKW
jgi:hypothetical protein